MSARGEMVEQMAEFAERRPDDAEDMRALLGCIVPSEWLPVFGWAKQPLPTLEEDSLQQGYWLALGDERPRTSDALRYYGTLTEALDSWAEARAPLASRDWLEEYVDAAAILVAEEL